MCQGAAERLGNSNASSTIVRPAHARFRFIKSRIDGAYLPPCCMSLAGLIGCLMETKRVSLLPVPGAIGDRRIASKRKIKISDSIALLPGSTIWVHLIGASAWRKSA